MAKVKVWNDNKHPHTEMYKGDKITIPAGEFIEMDWEEAMQFKGQFTGVAPVKSEDDGKGGMGEADPRFFKMIRVEMPKEDPVVDDGLTNHLTGKRANSAGELLGQLLSIARDNPDLVVKDKDLDGKKEDRVAVLERELAELKALIQGNTSAKKGPGRPRKEA